MNAKPVVSVAVGGLSGSRWPQWQSVAQLWDKFDALSPCHSPYVDVRIHQRPADAGCPVRTPTMTPAPESPNLSEFPHDQKGPITKFCPNSCSDLLGDKLGSWVKFTNHNLQLRAFD